MDERALAMLHAEHVDWRFKGLPPAMQGRSVGELAQARLDLFEAGFTTPVLTLSRTAVEHNIAMLAGFAAEHGLDLAPHGKTSMAPQLFARQAAHGAWGMTAATITQVRTYRAFGVSRIFLANELVNAAALSWIATELAADPGFTFVCCVDSVRGVALMDEALQARPWPRPVDVVVELGTVGGRAGCRTPEEARQVAEAVADSRALRLIGMSGYEGTMAHDATRAAPPSVRDYLRTIAGLTRQFDIEGRFKQADEIVVSAGGTAYFDIVAEELAGPWMLSQPTRVLLRSGAYVTHDDGFYAALAPHSRGTAPALWPALLLWSQVISRPEPGLALLDFGKRDASFDAGLPVPRQIRRSDRISGPAEGLEVVALNDQHAYLAVDADTHLEVGDWVGCGISHPCTVFDKWPLIPMVDDGIVVDYIRTLF
ncbi:amino acid deaminase [Nonomuraea sp. NPDC050536]|uniref:amino acid deaminase n=1 Tax=Nonomuraea sp. NPDC050536 TaxID=3364366 RepID=UPI0037CCA6C1